MGRSNISECGRRFTSEYQPAGRGRPKGSLNRSTIVRAYFESQEPRPLEDEIKELLAVIFGKKRPKRRRKAQARDVLKHEKT
jgi:hypothetical protein